MSPM